MALSKNQFTGGKLFILKVRSKDENDKNVAPYFQVSTKVDDKWIAENNGDTTVSGVLTKVAFKSSEYEGVVTPKVQLYLRDGDDTYLLDSSYTMLSRSIFNSLLGMENFGDRVEISLYTNKKGYPSAGVKVGTKRPDWKFGLDEMPKPAKIMFKGKEMSDFTEVDSFFEQNLQELAAAVEEYQATSGVQSSSSDIKPYPKKEDVAISGPVVDEEDEQDSLF